MELLHFHYPHTFLPPNLLRVRRVIFLVFLCDIEQNLLNIN
jgi:hypothetical protein